MSWNVAYVKHQCEFSVVRDLRDEDITAYAPTRKYLSRPRHLGSGKPVEITVPLYARYIFFRGDTDQALAFTQAHKNVIGIVRFGEEYARLPDKEIERLMDIVEQGLYDDWYEPSKPVVGDAVDIIKGPFSGKTAIISQHSTANKAVVVITESGKSLSISLPWEQLD